jgi:hypothetical protein
MAEHGLANLYKISAGMLSAASGDGSASCSGGSDNDVEPETDYRRRCRQLEVSLVKFKEKATRIRELLSIKVALQINWDFYGTLLVHACFNISSLITASGKLLCV